MVCPTPDGKALEELFRYEVFKMLKAEGKISDALIENLMSWRHSGLPWRDMLTMGYKLINPGLGQGFNVYCGNAIWPHNEEGLENLARYIIRASFSQERMAYLPAHESSDSMAKVIHESKACPRHRSGNGNTKKTFDALDWLALLTTHIPNRGEQMVRYYGYYSNKSRGMRKKQGKDDVVPSLIESDISPSAFRKDWARLIQKIYNVDPLVCPKCQGRMRLISFIEDPEVIKKILKHLGLWLVKPKPPPRANGPPVGHHIDYADTQFPSYDDYNVDPEYPIDTYVL